ncbi:arginine--tRNA ligase [Candidatus Nomurabacteria bacterium RIFCSPLOWO2_01_FULL_42_20]|uniref:Arginine--tRNA ligase n=1 Tax=Candidatus Nomurabacteria bacterium RIFCSPHIGHO2_01_FULL_42_16 TaxID=1801743 RepID=A0A1F6VJ87_9BACT|nr:MAG: arginine--tRNA ligase [Candidatus Nomurabacteria bacterium RIFCSPHIGHO2_01_FULL_42_16]OGI91916.1 MAG: arginine--tRNA ligase [Candidatus Nomurabacteria bacterium RIFCSPLOWO2_01_FULL_42_20]
MIREKIKKSIEDALKKLEIEAKEIHLEHPEDLSHGDYSTNVAMVLAPKSGLKPLQLAEKLKSDLSKGLQKGGFIEKIDIAGPGFINFYLSPEFFNESIKEILERKSDFGKNDLGKGKKVIVEYSSPNIAKPFTIGHLRSTIIGDSIAKILEFSGHQVIRDNHIGDWGTQFGKLIVAIKKWGDEKKLNKSKNPVKILVDLYIKFHKEVEKNPKLEDEAREWFKKLEQHDKETFSLWKKIVDWSMKEFNRLYGRLGVKFDEILPESFFEEKMREVLEEIKNKKIGQMSEGALVIFFTEESHLPPLLVQKSDGTSLYATRELATDKYRKEKYGKDIVIINEVGSEQKEYFKQIFAAEEMLGWFKKGERVHISHGLYRLPEGRMSTRKGNAVWLEDIVNEAVKRAGEFNREVAEPVAIGALKFNDLKRESKSDIVFSWDEILNLKGDSGPYLQYTYARARSVLLKAEQEKIKPSTIYHLPATDPERLLYRFPEVVERAVREYSPHYIAIYLLDLASAFNSFYNEIKIVDKNDPDSPYKVALTQAVSIILKNGLWLLGIQTPEKM